MNTNKIVDEYCKLFHFEDDSNNKNLLLSMANDILGEVIKTLKIDNN